MRALVLCIGVFLPLQTLSFRAQWLPTPVRSRRLNAESVSKGDPYSTFSWFEKVLFHRFSESVYTEMKDLSGTAVPYNYQSLISLINSLTFSRPFQEVNEKSKSSLVRLFPPWLLRQYKWMFAEPFPLFSAWMNAWVTHWTTTWLMGDSKIYNLELPNGEEGVQQGLLIEKCRFLETAGCMQTCIHACKIPTQRFFLEEMGLPVTLTPNVTDFSCKFEFGVHPLPIEQDPIFSSPCLDICSVKKREEKANSGSCRL